MKITNVLTDQKHAIDKRCIVCQLSSFERLLSKNKVSEALRQEFSAFYQRTIKASDGITTPEIHQKLNKEYCRLTNINDLYIDEKKESNAIAKKLYAEWKPKVLAAENTFESALRLSIAGNIMDYGANNDFDLHKTIEKVMVSNFAINHSLELKKCIAHSKNLLYLGDNAGEIVFDKLFIEIMQHKNVTFAVRGSAVLNDATMDDALEVNMNEQAKLITNGYDAPSTVLSLSSLEFLEVYNKADLIISKGQGNLEGLIHENDPRIFFLLMIKCDVVAELLDAPKGGFVVYNTTI
jgi:uncharacterized protein with ATP-grasp and redox domains